MLTWTLTTPHGEMLPACRVRVVGTDISHPQPPGSVHTPAIVCDPTAARHAAAAGLVSLVLGVGAARFMAAAVARAVRSPLQLCRASPRAGAGCRGRDGSRGRDSRDGQ